MTHEIPFIFWPLLFIQILLFYKKSAGQAEVEENLNSRKSPRAALSRARSLQEETRGDNFVHHFLGETSDYTGDYRIIRYYMSSGFAGDYEDITLATFATVVDIRQLWKLARKWQGPMSISLFVDGDQATIAHIAIEKFRKCSGLDDSIPLHFHLVYSTSLEALTDDARLAELQQRIDFAQTGLRLPKNLLRNIAKDSASTDFVLSADISLSPNDNLRENFLKFANKENLFDATSKQAFVIPAFEIKHGLPFPRRGLVFIFEIIFLLHTHKILTGL
ncbi:unnamed protein product [Oikopleura dioica]|uniref:Beta-1,4-glucuronyltransferase 1 n=1 Tax=Oikopleura dioica TaxID=34765 RepID=E4XPC7_OIKDI|nr:unnamed protein product [Oikopleura dioica]